jgi:hypothetical protein
MTTSGRIRKRVESAAPGTFFRLSDFAGTSSAVESAMSRLARSGLVQRVRHGLYWKGVRSRFGAGRPPALAVGVELAGAKGVGPAGWTASHSLGLTTQVPPTAELSMVGRGTPRAPEGIHFHSRANLDRLRLRFHEIALLEVLRDWPATTDTDWAQLVQVVHELNAKGVVDLARLRRNVRREPPKTRRLVASLMPESDRVTSARSA